MVASAGDASAGGASAGGVITAIDSSSATKDVPVTDASPVVDDT